MSAMQIKAECAAKALADAGLTWKDVDAVYDTGGDQGIGGLGAAEYFGFNPRVIDTTLYSAALRARLGLDVAYSLGLGWR